jgi:hypothetical protein
MPAHRGILGRGQVAQRRVAVSAIVVALEVTDHHLGDVYHDVTEWMKSSLSWVVSSALQFATEQADLVPDEDLDAVADLALSAINDVAMGTRLDSPILSPQIHLSAYGLLAALAERLSASHARTLLEMLADAVVVKEHHYRRTDESHVEITAGIARGHDGELRATALEQLVGLYVRGAPQLRPTTV